MATFIQFLRIIPAQKYISSEATILFLLHPRQQSTISIQLSELSSRTFETSLDIIVDLGLSSEVVDRARPDQLPAAISFTFPHLITIVHIFNQLCPAP